MSCFWSRLSAPGHSIEVERSERCDRLRKQGPARLDIDCESRVAAARNPLQFAARLDDDHDKVLDDTLILLGLMPVRDPSALVQLKEVGLHYGSNTGLNSLSYPIYLDFRDQNDVFTGLLAEESSAYVTLRRSEAKEDTIAREAIETLTSSGVSLMPVGVEKDLKPQDVADVIALIRGLTASK